MNNPNQEEEFFLDIENSVCKTKSSSMHSETNRILQTPKISPLSAKNPSPYNLFSRDSEQLCNLSPRHFSLASIQNGNQSCNISLNYSDDDLFIQRQLIAEFVEDFKKNNQYSKDFESYYEDKSIIFRKLNCSDKKSKNIFFKNLRKTIKMNHSAKKTIKRLSNPTNSNPYILSILELSYKNILRKKSNSLKVSSDLLFSDY